MPQSETTINEDQFEFYEVTDVNDLPPGERLYLELDDKHIIIFNVEGEYFAIDDECTHDNGPLGDGELNDHHITCPRHGARFDIRSGKVLSLPAVQDVKTWHLRVADGKVEIGVKKEG